MKRFWVFIFLIVLAFGCSTVEPVSTCTSEVPASKLAALDQTQLQKDIKIIDDYLAAHNITATQHPSGLRYITTKFGSGGKVSCLQSAISVAYEGRLLGDGTLFDQSAEPRAFILSGLILGWQLAFLEFNKGTEATLYVPSGLGYGTTAGTTIPANSNLVFKVKLADFR